MSERAENLTISPDYAAYTVLTDEYAKKSPQHQGLTSVEFSEAVIDPTVYKTSVEIGEKHVSIPQLSPVEKNVWLNAEYYRKCFPDDYSAGNVMYYVDIPSVQPSEAVVSRVQELATSQGVLVFDYPDSDPAYPDRVRAVANAAGAEVQESLILGNQTYFVGQTILKRITGPHNSPKTFYEAYEAAVQDGSYNLDQLENGPSVQKLIGDEDAQYMLTFYEDAYQALNDHPCEQGLSPQEFMDMMTKNEDVIKFVNKVDGKITALCLLYNNLEDLSWVNPDFYQQNFGDKKASGQLMWFPGLAADPSSEAGNNTQAIVNLIAQLVEKGGNEMLIAFDCCDMNTGFLDVFLENMINKTPQASMKIETIAVQKYCALRLKTKQ